MKISANVRVFITITAFVLLVWADCNYFTAGTIIGTVLFGGALAVCILWKPFKRLVGRIWSKIGGRIALIAAGTFALFLASCCVIFSVNMTYCIERRIDDPQAVIVLGCQVRGETPSVMLAKRCNAAIETLSEYPDAICVVSGGQGSGEDISEAEAMRRYLVERGIDESRVIAEDKSTSTRENVAYSAEVLEKLGIDRAVIVTSDFHQYRAAIYAKRSGLTVGHHSGKTPRFNILNYWIREWAALFEALVRG